MQDKVADKKPPEMQVAVLSEAGKREENQDWMGWSRVPWGECYTLADGMGGYKGGATASRMTVEGVERYLKAQSPELPFEKALQEAVRKTNEEVYQTAQSGSPENSHMGSTLAVALISGGRLIVGNIGDSRVYLFRKGKLKQLTVDHTSVQRMVDAGMITAEQARTHPDAHILSRAVGSKADAELEIAPTLDLEEGDEILLCSDGLSGYAEDCQIAKTLSHQSDVQKVPKQLVDLALKQGSDDNITVQFIRYGKASAGRRFTAVLPEVKKRIEKGTQFRRVPRSVVAGAGALLAVAILVALPPVRKLFNSEETPPVASPGARTGTVAPVLPSTGGVGGSTTTVASAPTPRVSPPAGDKSQKAERRLTTHAATEPTPGVASSRPASANDVGATPPDPSSAPAASAADSPAPPAPVSASAGSAKVLVLILAGKADMLAAKKIENELNKSSSAFNPHTTELTTAEEPKAFIFFKPELESEAKDLQRKLKGITQKQWTTEPYEGSRPEQYEWVAKNYPGQKYLLLVFPRQQ